MAIGRSVSPDCGVDARMKQRLQQLLAECGADAGPPNTREDALRDLASAAHSRTHVDRRPHPAAAHRHRLLPDRRGVRRAQDDLRPGPNDQ
jgi:hypothetical protein